MQALSDLFGEIPEKMPRKRSYFRRSADYWGKAPKQMEFDLNKYLDSLPEVVWDKLQIRLLREHILARSLEIIRNKKANSQGFAEEVAWLYSDMPGPFSAEMCSLAAGYDLEEIREGLDFALTQDKRDRLRLIDNGKYDGGRNHQSVGYSLRDNGAERPLYAMA